MIETMLSMLFVNVITAMFLFGMYRLIKRDTDGYGLTCLIFPCLAVLALVIALQEQRQSLTETPEGRAAVPSQ